MCDYCDDLRHDLGESLSSDYDDGVVIEMTQEKGRWEIVAAGYYDGGYLCGSKAVEIDYCPMCGRRLKEAER